jgi:hypothetical protein
MKLSAATARRLAVAGWSEDRSVEVDPVIQEWAADRYPVNQLAVDFLRSFGFLELRYPHARDPTSSDGCHFDAIRATNNVSPETVRWWSERVRSPLVPIGEASTAHVTLVMATDGAVYGGYDHYLWKIGIHGEDAIEALCSRREPLLLPEPDEPPPG